MKAKLSDYNIEFKGLNDGKHHFEYQINDSFFSLVDGSLYDKGKIKLFIEMTKSSQMLVFDFKFEGEIETVCDNCLEIMMQPILYDYKFIVRFGDDYEDVDDNITIIPKDENKFNIHSVVYDCLVTSQPVRHLHPEDANGNSTCNPEMIKKLESYMVKESLDSNKDEEIDPRWSELKKLLDNNN